MISSNYLYLSVVVVSLAGWGIAAAADGDVTVIPTPAATTAPEQKSEASDGTPVIHKSLHKKKPAETATAAAPAPATTPAVPAPATSAPAPANTAMYATTTSYNPAPGSLTPSVETGLPVARYPGVGTPITGVSTYVPDAIPLPTGKSIMGTTTRQPMFASTLPSSVLPLTSSATGIYSTPSRTTTSTPTDFAFVNFPRKIKNFYPWKTNIITTIFWIGEGSTPISSTTNVQSSWDEDWLQNNHGSDSPYNRNGYSSGNHASTLNPFYVALPFNDLAFPDKAREYLPPGWYRRPRDGKQVSACKDRWIEIKNAQGRTCYAQWEDVGPLRYDHAEYVFGSERPIGLGDDHAGLDVSPAVAQYLGIDGKNRFTSWRFVDDEDVRPGYWLQLDEQAVLFSALHQMKNSSLPIQRLNEPTEDSQNIDSNKKKVDASKG